MADQGCKLFVYGINENMDNGEVKVMYLTCLPYSSFTSCTLQAEFEKFGQVTRHLHHRQGIRLRHLRQEGGRPDGH